MVPTVRVGRFLTRAEADVARSYLEAQGLPASVLADDMAGIRPDGAYGYGGITLAVHPDDAELARQLLDDASPSDPADTPRRGPARAALTALVGLLVAAGLLVGVDALRGLAG